MIAFLAGSQKDRLEDQLKVARYFLILLHLVIYDSHTIIFGDL